MARRRDYKAEYRARQQRSRQRYGVSYGEFRRLQQQAKRQGVSPDAFRNQMFKQHTIHGHVDRIRQVLRAQKEARTGTGISRIRGQADLNRLYDRWADEFVEKRWFWYH